MARPGGVIKRPALPPNMLKELGAGDSKGPRSGPRNRSIITSRKERRKAERQQKKARPVAQVRRPETNTSRKPSPKADSKSKPPKADSKHTPTMPVPVKNGRAIPKIEPEEDPFADFDDEDDDMLSDGILDEGSDDNEDMDKDMEALEEMEDDDDDDDDDDDEEDDLLGGDGSEDEDILDEDDEAPQPSRKVPKFIKSKLAEDDAEIADLERKLGIKGKKKGLPKSFLDEGLGDLLGELDEAEEEGGMSSEKRKRKAEADEWLAQKRRKAELAAAAEAKKQKQTESDDDMEGLDEDSDDDMGGMEEDSEGFDEDGFESEEEAPEPVKKVKENPYVAPTTGQTAKYVPPSLRKETGSDSELAARIRRQTQGLINRITESNLLTILDEIEKLYREYPRQHVSSSLIGLLLIQVCDPTSLPDTLLILTAGFASAAYKVIGTDLGAQMIQEVVDRFDKYYAEAKVAALERPDVPKQTSNLITFIAELYNFQMIGHNIVFDYIKLLLDDLSELNAELLLRIVRMCGPTLRQDDPMALKDIVTLIPPAVAKYGEKNLTVRTKFMIETITDLKNNKLKAGAVASAVISEHLTRMKKTLGQLKSRKLKATEPLRIGLKDIKDADKTGKWWLVGASWGGKDKSSSGQAGVQPAADEDESDAESVTLDGWDEGPDLLVLAKEQGMNTEVRRSIFVTVLSALDCQDAYLRLLKLKLNKERQKEVATVLVRLAGAEEAYNPYYTLVAKKMCETQRQIKWSFQAALWKMLGKFGESGFVDEADEEVLDEKQKEKEFSTQRIIGTAKMFGSLIAAGHIGLVALKRLNWYQLQPMTKDWLDILINTVLIECQKGKKGEKAEEEIVKLFGTVGVELVTGLQYFLRKVTKKSNLTGNKKEARLVKEGCKMADAALRAVLIAGIGQ
ncbi:hypothetical protein QBC38DRAFT_415322 [Podospora fimiseda]|uniref:MI domain-containing protein n=1 Tax=Podospora fimiseda TaxID=252190 RepID=A0AAN7H037_9PEZI|nr:hypothetical protein QBC38DRAFT_415322 [Podospora fimiseda]